jgi:circadian clock protein KaiC
VARLQAQIEQRRRRARAQIEAIQADLAVDEAELNRLTQAEVSFRAQSERDVAEMERSRGVIGSPGGTE